MQDTQQRRVWSLGQEDPLEQEMATHSSILTWKIPWTEEPGGLQSLGSQRFGHDLATEQHCVTQSEKSHLLKLEFSRGQVMFDFYWDIQGLISGHQFQQQPRALSQAL